ncbi:MAG: hypothetical protein ACYDFT_04775 [Thermoplasmata archaeon]
MAQRRELRGAFGLPAPPLSAAALAHPDRILRFHRYQQLLWVARFGIIATLLLLLLTARGVLP